MVNAAPTGISFPNESIEKFWNTGNCFVRHGDNSLLVTALVLEELRTIDSTSAYQNGYTQISLGTRLPEDFCKYVLSQFNKESVQKMLDNSSLRDQMRDVARSNMLTSTKKTTLISMGCPEALVDLCIEILNPPKEEVTAKIEPVQKAAKSRSTGATVTTMLLETFKTDDNKKKE